MYIMFLNLGFKKATTRLWQGGSWGRRLKVGNAGENGEGEAREVLSENAIMKSNTLYANSENKKKNHMKSNVRN